MVVITVNKWTDVNGNTMHKVRGIDTSKNEKRATVEPVYGYGYAYMDTACKLFECNSTDIAVLNVVRVERRKDL